MQKFSYHTHTTFSDGSDTLENMIEEAIRLGWTEMGISDHLIVHKNMKQSPAYPYLLKYAKPQIYHSSFAEIKESFARHADVFRKTVKNYPIKIYLGYEVDYFSYDGWEEELRDFLKDLDYDYLISGNHFFQTEDFETIVDVFRYEEIAKDQNGEDLKELLKRHYQTIADAVSTGLFAFLAHPDYARKISAHKNYPLKSERLNIVQKLAESNTGCEISTKGLRKIGDFYPERFFLEALIQHNIPIVISDDAHRKEELGLDFDKAEKTLKELLCQNRLELNKCS